FHIGGAVMNSKNKLGWPTLSGFERVGRSSLARDPIERRFKISNVSLGFALNSWIAGSADGKTPFGRMAFPGDYFLGAGRRGSFGRGATRIRGRAKLPLSVKSVPLGKVLARGLKA